MNNDKFYETLSVTELEEFAQRTFGKDLPSDVEQILTFISPPQMVIEVGSGTGRVGIELIKRGIFYVGVERQMKYSQVFFQKLRGLGSPSITSMILHDPFEMVRECKFQGFSAVIFPWTVIGDFSKDEQLCVLEKAYTHLDTGGLCIIDNPATPESYNQYGYYKPTPFYYVEWRDRLIEIGLPPHYVACYITKTGVKRELIVLQKR